MVVCDGATVPDTVLPLITRPHVMAIEFDSLTPASLLQAIVKVTDSVGALELRTHLSSHSRFRALPERLIDAFIEDPHEVLRLKDLCRVLEVSAGTARQVVHSARFRRAEHLCTAIRAEMWVFLALQGLQRSELETYLGISDRRTFRRSCRRAGVTVPWKRSS